MKRLRVHLDSFSGALSDLPKGQRTQENALRVLAADPRVSTFDRGPAWLEHLLSELKGNGLIVEEWGEPYPWHRYSLTEAGRRMLEAHK
jgi:DNA-binding HxlR family transcriptional regulator